MDKNVHVERINYKKYKDGIIGHSFYYDLFSLLSIFVSLCDSIYM